MDYRYSFVNLYQEVLPIPENYNHEKFAKELIEAQPSYSKEKKLLEKYLKYCEREHINVCYCDFLIQIGYLKIGNGDNKKQSVIQATFKKAMSGWREDFIEIYKAKGADILLHKDINFYD